MDTRRFALLLIGVLAVAGWIAAPAATAQSLEPPSMSTDCAPASATALYNEGSDEEAACQTRTYRVPATDTVALRHDRYDGVNVVAWDSAAVAIEAVIVARRVTLDSARADVERVRLRRGNGTIEAVGPPDDAPGWWSVGYRLRVPRQTALAITTYSGSIDVRGVVGAHEIRSDHGSIDLTLPASAGVRLQAETDYGTIDVGFPVTTQGAISERLDAVVGGGGPTVRLASGDDVTIQRE
jgi:hypothetical protein